MEKDDQLSLPKYPMGKAAKRYFLILYIYLMKNLNGVSFKKETFFDRKFWRRENYSKQIPKWSLDKFIYLNGQYKPLGPLQTVFIPDRRTHLPDLSSMEIFDDDIRISCYVKCGKKINNKVIATRYLRVAITNTNLVRSARLHALCSE